MKRFEPKRPDGRSYRDVVVDVLKDLSPGEIVAYAAFAKALDLDPDKDRAKIQAAVRAANKVLLAVHSRGVASVSKIGYRVLPAREHITVAGGHQSKADRAMQRAISFYQGTNLSELTEIERRLHEGQQMLAIAILASHQHLDRRMRKIESLLRGGKTIDE